MFSLQKIWRAVCGVRNLWPHQHQSDPNCKTLADLNAYLARASQSQPVLLMIKIASGAQKGDVILRLWRQGQADDKDSALQQLATNLPYDLQKREIRCETRFDQGAGLRISYQPAMLMTLCDAAPYKPDAPDAAEKMFANISTLVGAMSQKNNWIILYVERDERGFRMPTAPGSGDATPTPS